MLKGKCSFLLYVMIMGAFLFTTVPPVEAQEYPTRPVTLIAPFQAGGAADVAARLLGEVAQKYLGQPIIVENKVGASGQIAADFLARQRPDGYTMATLFYSQTHGEYFRYFRDATSTSKDFRLVAQFSAHTFAVVVKADDPFNSLRDLVEYTKKNPGLDYGPGAGKGNFFHVTMTAFADKTGIKLVDVPTKGDPDILTQILGGHLRMGLGTPGFFTPYIKSGKVKAIAIFADNRLEDLPEVPTFKEQGYDLGFGEFYLAVFVQAKTPDPVVAKLREVMKKTCQDPKFISGMKALGQPVVYCDGEAMDKKINDFTAVLIRVFKQLGYLK
jgi:tripartite-type tricarboxylate transporter receptor subunit TctC